MFSRDRVEHFGHTAALGCFVVLAAALGIASTPSSAAAQSDARASAKATKRPLARTLRYGGRTFQEWVEEFLTELEPERRLKALPALTTLGRRGHAAQAAATIADALADDESPDLVEAAIEHLARLEAAAVPVLVEKLKDESHRVRIAAAKALGQIGPLAAEAVPALLSAAALGVEVKTGGGDVLLVLLAQEAFEALLQIASPSTPAVLEGLKHPTPSVRVTCIQLLERMARERHAEVPMDELVSLLDDGDRLVRSTAAVTIWRLASESRSAVAALTAALRKNAADFGRELVLAFGRPPDRRHAAVDVELCVAALEWPGFARMESHENPNLQSEVLKTLAMLGPHAAPAVHGLSKLLGSRDPWLCCAATDVLGAIGPGARDVIEALQSLADDETPVEGAAHFGRAAEASDATAASYGTTAYGLPLPIFDRNRCARLVEPVADTIGAHARAALARIERPGTAPR